MELKTYQRQVLADLESYLKCLNETHDVFAAYRAHWLSHDVKVGPEGVPFYQNNIPGVPHVCFKVPTGGGKTYLACASVKAIFDAMPLNKTQAAVWLVPSNAILEQTVRNLSDSSHPYRQRLDRDFGGRVMVYTKEQLLSGQQFSPASVLEHLSICILSYDSLRSSKKDGRKVYQQNSQLAQFVPHYSTRETLVEEVDDTALIQVLNQLSPVVIVDESHNAQSDLSVEMLKNLNPSFVLDLTATPKSNSNIISYVDARELKKEHMVKLPVVVYNRHSKQDVLFDAIKLRGSIEQQAVEEEKNGGRYIRPIVLFQAQPKGKEDSATFEKLKEELIGSGIPAEEIAIKTSNINEIRNVNLLSRDCKIRYIITVNALKEGWDCPFAYILATLANKTSRVDVEQIVGRILRQPYAKTHGHPLLNNSYVLTCSNAFWDTLDNIIVGLNHAGFSKQDMRVGTEQPEPPAFIPDPPEQLDMESVGEPPEEFLDVDFQNLRDRLQDDAEKTENTLPPSVTEMIEEAKRQNADYEAETKAAESSGVLGGELGQMMNQFHIQPDFSEEVSNLRIPQFFFETQPDLFHKEGFTLCSKEHFSDGFTLRNEDAKISFEHSTGDVYAIDLAKSGEAVPKYQRMSRAESEYIHEHLARMPEEDKIRTCVGMICKELNKSDTLEAKDLRTYVERIVAGMNSDEIASLETALPVYISKIRLKIRMLEDAYREKQFNKQLDTGEIICRPGYTMPKVITPVNVGGALSHSLYESESSMDNFEMDVISRTVGLGTIKWWHRIIERKDFYINGFIHHYPDFMVMTDKGHLVLIEAKGDYLANDDSKQKLRLGRAWAEKAGEQFKYFMVFQNKDMKLDGAYMLDEFIDIMQKL